MDCWTTKNAQIPFMGITAHWIDDAWIIQHLCIGLLNLEGTHTGENLAEAFIEHTHKKHHVLDKVE